MKILIIGGGGREHALAWKCAEPPYVEKVFCAPGNAGTAQENKVENVAIPVEDLNSLVSFAEKEKIGLTIIHVDNKNLIFGDIFLNEKSIQYFRIYFIDKKNNFFKELKISMPGSNLENEVIEGNCQNKN